MTPKSPFCNWVIPGEVLCGPYPGLDGINCPTLDAATANLQAILDDNITVFVCLQAQGELTNQHPYFPKFEHYRETLTRMGRAPQFLHFPLPDQGTPDKRAFTQQMTGLCDLVSQGHRLYIHCAGGHGRTGLYVACLLLTLHRRGLRDFRKISGQLNVGAWEKPQHLASNVMYYVQNTHDSRAQIDKRAGKAVRSPNTDAQIAFVYDYATFLTFL